MKQQQPIKQKEREVSVEQYLVRQCLNRGWMCWKMSPENNRGVQDRIVLPGDGRTYFAELKRKGGKASKLQEFRWKTMFAMGYDVHILEDKDAVDVFLTRVDSGIYR